jgi:hypothetical protein
VSDDGSSDFTVLPPGGRSKSGVGDYASGSTDELLQLYQGFAVIQVVSRGVPTAIADPGTYGARPSSSHPPPGNGASDFEVIRPARFAVVRQLKGSIPACLDLDVPGGTAGLFSSNGFAPAFGVGDQMLALLQTHDDAGAPTPWAWALLRADKNGMLTLPFGDHDLLNVNTWTPTALALSPPPPLPPTTVPASSSYSSSSIPPVVRDGSTLSSG